MSDAPQIRDRVHFEHQGRPYQGEIMDIRPHVNDSSVRFAFVVVYGEPRLFPVPFQRQGDGWKLTSMEVFTGTEDNLVLNG